MPRPETYLLLEHMLAHAREAAEMVRGRQRVDLDTDRKLNLALVRLLEIVGEAASRVSRTEQDRIVGMPWPEIVRLRNRLIHGYDSVDFDILWQDFARSRPARAKRPLKPSARLAIPASASAGAL